MVDRTTILVATTNPGKLREVQAVLSGLPFRLATLAEWPQLSAPEETGSTFDANARLKAMHYAQLTGMWTLADDSGLEVDALGGEPGVRSARYAQMPSQGASMLSQDAANNTKLVAKLAGVPAAARTARYRCVVALASPQQVVCVADGTVAGLIIDEPRGGGGFGYDPHFLVPEFGATMAELPLAQKNRISHRGRALRALYPTLERLADGGHTA